MVKRESQADSAGDHRDVIEHVEQAWDPQPGRRGHLAGPPREEYRQAYGQPYGTDPQSPRQAERFLSAPTISFTSPTSPPAPSLPGRRSIRMLFDILLIAATAAALVAVVFVTRELITPRASTAPTQPPVAVSPAGAASPPSSAPTASAATLTLRSSDLPGFRAVQAGAAQFGGTSGSPAPDSWDVVFQSGEPSSREFRAAESIVLIYSSPEAALASLRREQAAEPARGARLLGSSDFGQSVGQDGQVWEEPLAGAPNYRLVRVLFRVGRAMSEVTLAAPAAPAQAREAVRLAGIQADRLAGL